MTLWYKLDRTLVLASKSPRRADILNSMGLTFDVKVSGLDNEDDYIDTNDLEGSLPQLALAKARAVSRVHSASLVLAGDTIVVIDNYIMGKPSSLEDARSMLRRLSGKTHHVLSGLALVCEETDFCATALAKTAVTFRRPTDTEIDAYLAHNDHADKAGAYGIQGKAMTLVESIDGCYYNVVGLPVSKAIDLFDMYVNNGPSTRKD